MNKQRNDSALARKRERNRVRQEAKRRAAGAWPHEQSIQRMRPWEMLGVSRSTYYRRSKEAMAQSAEATR